MVFDAANASLQIFTRNITPTKKVNYMTKLNAFLRVLRVAGRTAVTCGVYQTQSGTLCNYAMRVCLALNRRQSSA